MGAIGIEGRDLELAGLRPAALHQVHQAIEGVGARAPEQLWIAAHADQLGGVVASADVVGDEGGRIEHQPRRQVRHAPQRHAIGERLARPAPDRWREQHQPVGRGRPVRGESVDGDRPAHADPGHRDDGMREAPADQGGEGAQIVVQQPRPGPHPSLRRAAETALVEGIGRDPLPRPMLGGQVEGVGIVIHAMQADHHGPGLTRRIPVLHPKPRPVEADEVPVLQARPLEIGARRSGLLKQRRATGEQQQQGEGERGPHLSISATRAFR